MLAEDRFHEILKLLERKQSVTVLELTESLGISESTIRRDLTELHKQGMLVKVHGGAVANSKSYMTVDPEIALRQELNRDEKISIARYCASLIEDNDFIYLDAGTTTELIIDYLSAVNAVFVTNGINHAKKLAARGYDVYLLGGMLKTTTEAVVGSETIEGLKKYNFTKGFFGANGVSRHAGFTTPETEEALVKKNALIRCAKKYVACDYSKFKQISPVTFADFQEVTIITNKVTDQKYMNYEHIVEVEKL